MAPRVSQSKFALVKARQMSDLEKAYIACAIDTEGSLMIYRVDERARPVLRISIYNTNLAFLQVCQGIIKAGTINNGPTGVGFRKKGCYCLRVGRMADILAILKQIQPWLIIKQDKADEMIVWLEERLTKPQNDQVQAALSTLVGRGLVRMDVSVFPPRYERV